MCVACTPFVSSIFPFFVSFFCMVRSLISEEMSRRGSESWTKDWSMVSKGKEWILKGHETETWNRNWKTETKPKTKMEFLVYCCSLASPDELKNTAKPSPINVFARYSSGKQRPCAIIIFNQEKRTGNLNILAIIIFNQSFMKMMLPQLTSRPGRIMSTLSTLHVPFLGESFCLVGGDIALTPVYVHCGSLFAWCGWSG